METVLIINKMKIGVTLLFKDKNSQNLKGILKSVVIDANDIMESAKLIGDKISDYYKYDYLGINDLFSVSAEPQVGELLGRTTFYELDNLDKSKSLINENELFLEDDNTSKMFNCSLIYFCENDDEKYTISILSIAKSNNKEIISYAESIAKSNIFIKKIKSNSLEKITKIEFIGVEAICEIDLKFNVFQSFYSNFDSLKVIKEELLSNDEIEDILEDILQ